MGYGETEEERWGRDVLAEAELQRQRAAADEPKIYGTGWGRSDTRAWLLNAFSLQMIDNIGPGGMSIWFSAISQEEFEQLRDSGQLRSAIGHADTAAILGVEHNRTSVELHYGNTFYVAQLVGGRLPEGATELPDGFRFKFIRGKFL